MRVFEGIQLSQSFVICPRKLLRRPAGLLKGRGGAAKKPGEEYYPASTFPSFSVKKQVLSDCAAN